MVEVSNSDMERILSCLDISMAHYKAKKGLRNKNHAWAISLLKDKLTHKLITSKNLVKKNETSV